MTALRIALLGAGNHSRSNHGPSLRDYCEAHPGAVELVAVCDLDEARARACADEFGFAAVHTDLARMLATERLDGLVAVTPMEVTEAVAGQALRAGVPLVIEKPPAVGVAATQGLWRLARETGTPHMVSFNRRFCPALTRARAWLAETGRQGRHLVSRMLRTGRTEPFFARDTGLHQVDAVLAVAGRPLRVRAHRERSPGSRAALYTGRLECAEGITASFVIAPDVGRKEETLEILGDGFRAVVDFQAGAVQIDADGRMVLSWSAAAEGLPEHQANGAADETAAFLEALRDGTPLAPTMDDALAITRIAVALQEDRTIEDVSAGLP